MAKALNLVKPVDDIADTLADRLGSAPCWTNCMTYWRRLTIRCGATTKPGWAGTWRGCATIRSLQRQVQKIKERIIAHEQVRRLCRRASGTRCARRCGATCPAAIRR